MGSRLQSSLPYLVAAATRALLGIAFAHLIPEAVQQAGAGFRLGALLTAGLLGSFLLERVLSGYLNRKKDQPGEKTLAAEPPNFHHHQETERQGSALVANVLFGGVIHSFVDGLAIAAGFAVSHKLGVAATIAVLLHEVPHHVADVGVLIFGGLSKIKAVLWAALAGCTCLVGGVFLLGRYVSNLSAVLLPITAANFLYIAIALLMPELQEQ